MKINLLFTILINITNLVFCNVYNYGNEEISALILAVADNNGQIAGDSNGWLSVINGYINGYIYNPIVEDISYIIPSLSNAWYTTQGSTTDKENAVNTQFSKIYRLAMETYQKYFDINGIDKDNIIDSYDIIKYLTTGIGGTPIGLFDSSIDKEIYYPVNDNVYKEFVEAIQYGSNYNFFTIRLKEHTSNNLNLIHPEPNIMYKIAEICFTTSACKKYFQNHEHKVNNNGNRYYDSNDGFYLSDVNYIILKSKVNGVERYHLFTADNKNNKMAHQFAIKKNKNGNWEKDTTLYGTKEKSYTEIANDLSKQGRLANYGKTYNNGVHDRGIGIFAACDLKFKDTGNNRILYASKYRDTDNHVSQINNKYKYATNNNIHISRASNQYEEIELLISKFVTRNNNNSEAQRRALNFIESIKFN